MPIASRLGTYLHERGVHFEVVPHPHTGSSRQTAREAHVDADRLAKSVLVLDERGYLLAVLPASRRLSLRALREETGRQLSLATEPELGGIFGDCEVGAVPPIGAAYGVPTIVDEELLHLPDVWFDAGDHHDLVHVRGADFAELLHGAAHARFGEPEESGPAGADVRGLAAREHRLDESELHVLSLRAFGAGLRAQREYEREGHTGMILVKTPELRVVLEAAAAGARLATHVVRGPTTLLVLEGALEVATSRGQSRVGEGEMAVLPRDEQREIHSLAQSLFLLALSPVAHEESGQSSDCATSD
jgi:Ala-tRNA(Pro) deacylase